MNKFKEFWAIMWKLTRGDCLNCGHWYDFHEEPGIPLMRTPDDDWEIPICGKCQRKPDSISEKLVMQRLNDASYTQSDLDSARAQLRKFLEKSTVIQFPTKKAS